MQASLPPIGGSIKSIGISILCLMIKALIPGIFLMMINILIKCLEASKGKLKPFTRSRLCGAWNIRNFNVQMVFQFLLKNSKSKKLNILSKISNLNNKIMKLKLQYKFRNLLSPKSQAFLHSHIYYQSFYKFLMKFIVQMKK